MTVHLIKDLWYFILSISFPVENVKRENFEIIQRPFPCQESETKRPNYLGFLLRQLGHLFPFKDPPLSVPSSRKGWLFRD
jgi:hypothetical protein